MVWVSVLPERVRARVSAMVRLGVMLVLRFELGFRVRVMVAHHAGGG